MTSSLKTYSSLTGLISKTAELQSLVEFYISQDNEIEAEKYSKLYELEIQKIFQLRDLSQPDLIVKLDFAQTLIAEEHPMASLIQMVFESLREDITELFSGEPKEDQQTPDSSL